MLKKLTAIVSLLSYLITALIPQNVFAFDYLKKEQQPDFANYSILENTNLIPAKLFGTNILNYDVKPDVVLILDMHCQPYVQKNIYSIIKYFDEVFDVDKIFIEGAPKGEVDISIFNDIDETLKEKVFDEMLAKGLLSGTEFFTYMKKNSKLYGIEDFNLYKKALNEYYFLSKNESYFINQINIAIKNLRKQKIKFYSDDMLVYDKVFSNDNFDDDKNLFLLEKLANETHVQIEKYSNIKNFILIKRYEQRLNKEKFNGKSVELLLTALKFKLSFFEYSQLLNKIKNKTVEEGLICIYPLAKKYLDPEYLKNFESVKIFYDKYLLHKNLDIKLLLKEKQKLKQDIKEKLFKEENVANIDFLNEYLNLLKQAVCLKIDFDQVYDIYNDKEKFETLLKVSSFIRNQKELIEIADNEILQSYYENNIKRNSVFAKNIFDEINVDKTNVVVTGGFHKNITDFLEEKNLKYIVVVPNAVSNNYFTYNKIVSDIVKYNFNALSDGLFVIGISGYKIQTFLNLMIKKLRADNLSDIYIYEYLSKIINKNKLLFNGINLKNLLLSTNIFSIRGWFIKIKQIIKSFLHNIKFRLFYKYENSNKENIDNDVIKKMETNVKFFSLIQFMLGFNLFLSFDTLFMQSNGYSLALISMILSVLSPITFVTSLFSGAVSEKVSNRTVIVASLVLQTAGTIFFAFSGCSVFVLVASQILPAISITLLSLSLSPFLYESLGNMGQKDKFKHVYGSNLSLKWIIMSASSLMGGFLAYITNQFSVILLTAAVSVLITGASFKFTYNERLSDKNVENKNISVRNTFEGFVQPLKFLYSEKNILSLVFTNIVVSNIFFVVISFFLQPVLFATNGVWILAPLYFASNILQAIASYFIDKTEFVSKNKISRNIFFVSVAGLFGLFVLTGNPLLFAGIFLSMNFWQGSSGLTETTLVYNVLDDNMKNKWLSFKLNFGMLVATITQLTISGLLAVGFSNTAIVAMSITVLSVGSILSSVLFNKENKQNDSYGDTVDIGMVRQILACA